MFPSVEDLAELDPAHLALPEARQRGADQLIAALADGDVLLDAGCDWDRARHQLGASPGSALDLRGDRHARPRRPRCLPGHRPRRAGRPPSTSDCPTAPPLAEHSGRWRPWRSYATQHLWAALDHPVNTWPPKEP